MKRTIATLMIAVPMSIGTLTVGAGAAMADPSDQFSIPKNDFDPKGPGDITDIPKPKTPPKPKDLADKPKEDKPNPKPKPKVKPAAPKPTAEQPTVKQDKKVEEEPTTGDFIDKFFVPEAADVIDVVAYDVPVESNAMDLTWFLIGGGLITAGGAAYAARRVSRKLN